ncbi:hypothetical protein ACFYKX_10825 [Cytobacillus sp. FJAT-54145]|uniref:Uncharacterized protein n=1 Tax=Cytobacillus spartinae TaxID=3299023 RepID=A0ABW6KDW4_9BACI
MNIIDQYRKDLFEKGSFTSNSLISLLDVCPGSEYLGLLTQILGEKPTDPRLFGAYNLLGQIYVTMQNPDGSLTYQKADENLAEIILKKCNIGPYGLYFAVVTDGGIIQPPTFGNDLLELVENMRLELDDCFNYEKDDARIYNMGSREEVYSFTESCYLHDENLVEVFENGRVFTITRGELTDEHQVVFDPQAIEEDEEEENETERV